MIVGHPWTVDWRESNLDSAYAANHLAYGEAVAFVTLENPTAWSPHYGLRPALGVVHGYYDGVQLETLGEAYMGDLVESPTHGQQGIIPDVALMELVEESGIDVGGHLAQSITPRMVFANPPSYSEQTDPIPAIGYP